jgi:hypothetical protein
MSDHEKPKDVPKDVKELKEKDREKEKSNGSLPAEESHQETILPLSPKIPAETEEEASHYFFGEPLVGFDPAEITGNLVVIEGMDGSGRSTQIALLQEWLESEGFAVQTSGLRIFLTRWSTGAFRRCAPVPWCWRIVLFLPSLRAA